MRNWIGLSAAEAVLRLLLQVGATAVLARLLVPEVFGLAALTLTVVGFLSIAVGTPFEEGLAQRRILRRREIEEVLGLVFASALVAFLCAGLIGILLSNWFAREEFLLLLPFTALLLFAHGPFAIGTAIARRRRAFISINFANLIGNIIGTATGIVCGIFGAGVWSLLAFRVATVVASAASLYLLLGLRFVPRLPAGGTSRFDAFARTMLKARGVENATYILFNLLIAQFFGIAALGVVNMALRIVEPVRGTVAAMGHNLSFSLFRTAIRDRSQLQDAICTATGRSAILSAPIFMGLAAIAPLLIPMLAGPGWEQAAEISAFLALGGMLLMPSQILIAALTVQGQPEYGLRASLVGVLVLSVGLWFGAEMNVSAVGWARLTADLAQVVAVFYFGAVLVGLGPMRLIRVLFAPWTAAVVMALAVAGLTAALPAEWPSAARLGLAILSGVLVYAVFLYLIAREKLREVLHALMPSRLTAASQNQ